MVKKAPADDAFEVPPGIMNFTDDKKKDVAREMCRRTKLNNMQIAGMTGVPLRAVATIRGHVEGKLAKISDVNKERHAQEMLEPEAEEQATGEIGGERVQLHDIDAKAQERRPEPLEARVLHVESGLRDLGSRLNDVDARIGNGFEDLKERLSAGPPPSQAREPPTAGNGGARTAQAYEQVADRGQIRGQFEGITYKIPISSRQVTLFEMWRAKNNKFAGIDPGHYVRFEGDIGDLITQLALPEFFKLRGATIRYVEEEMTAEPA